MIFSFLLKNWRIWAFLGAIILIAAMVTYCLHTLNASEKRAKTAENDLIALKHGFALETAKRAQEHALKLQLSEQKAKQLAENYQAEIAKLNIDRAKLKRELSNEKDYLNSVLADAYELRVSAASSSAGRSEVPSATELSTETKRDCNGTLVRLIQAGQSCALDYKSLYESWQTNCDIYGCRN